MRWVMTNTAARMLRGTGHLARSFYVSTNYEAGRHNSRRSRRRSTTEQKCIRRLDCVQDGFAHVGFTCSPKQAGYSHRGPREGLRQGERATAHPFLGNLFC